MSASANPAENELPKEYLRSQPDYQRPAIISTPIAVRSVNAGRYRKTHAVTKNLQYTLCLNRRIRHFWSVVPDPIDCPQCLEMLSRMDESA